MRIRNKSTSLIGILSLLTLTGCGQAGGSSETDEVAIATHPIYSAAPDSAIHGSFSVVDSCLYFEDEVNELLLPILEEGASWENGALSYHGERIAMGESVTLTGLAVENVPAGSTIPPECQAAESYVSIN